MAITVGILGAGTWGLALSRVLALNEHRVTVWSALPAEIDELQATYKNSRLPGMELPKSIVFTTDLQVAATDKDIILMAVPSVFVRGTAKAIKEFIKTNQIIVDVAKGIEAQSHMMMSEVINDELKDLGVRVVALSGPTHAEEVALDLPTTIVSASHDEQVAEYVQDLFMNTTFRVYTNTDIKGVELSGALKNVIALAAGISQGLGYGDNAKAAIMTRGMAEIKRLGLAMSCHEDTFEGLAGIGDLIVTATSVHSRNNKAGQLIGQGYTVDDAISKVGMVVEGINALPAALELSRVYKVELPIISAVAAIIYENASPKETVNQLMTRDKKSEIRQEGV